MMIGHSEYCATSCDCRPGATPRKSESERYRAALVEIRDCARSTYSQECKWCDPYLSSIGLILRPHSPDCPAEIASCALSA